MTVRGRCQGILAGRGSNQINECVVQVWSKCKTVPVGQVGSAVKQTKLGKLRDQVDRAGHYSYAQMMILKTIEIPSQFTHTHTPPFWEICKEQEFTVQGWIWMQVPRWLRDTDRMEIQKCDGLTYR